MTDRLIRYSATQTFMQSRLKYYRQYIQRLERAYEKRTEIYEASAMQRGTIGHYGLEAHYRGHSDEFVHAAMQAKERKLSAESREAHAAIDRYLAWLEESGADKGLTPVQVEKRWYVELGEILGDRVTITFEPDVVVEDKFGMVRVFDHKFTQMFSSLTSFIGANRQGLTYMWGLRKLGMPAASFTLNQIRVLPPKTKTFIPVDRVTKYVDEREIQQHERYLRALVTDIVRMHQQVEAGDLDVAYPHPDFMCANACNMWEICCNAITKTDTEIATEIATNFRLKQEEF